MSGGTHPNPSGEPGHHSGPRSRGAGRAEEKKKWGSYGSTWTPKYDVEDNGGAYHFEDVKEEGRLGNGSSSAFRLVRSVG